MKNKMKNRGRWIGEVDGLIYANEDAEMLEDTVVRDADERSRDEEK